MIAIIDNYDSFTYNIYQYFCQLTDEPIVVFRNDKITVAALKRRTPTHIVISPGPGTPADAGISIAAVRAFIGRVPILGVCLGMQVIAAAFGGEVVAADRVVHGKAEPIRLDGAGLFRTLDAVSDCMRYHSLAVREESLPAEFTVTARAPDGEIMGIRHNQHVCEGVQFHPESIGTPQGMEMLRNFLRYRRQRFAYSALLTKLQAGTTLSVDEAGCWMDELTAGTLNDARIAGLLVALNSKGITVDEIVGCAQVLREKCLPALELVGTSSAAAPLLDTCGTGGDGLGTFNISSLSALVVASCGVRVAKHGNRAVSSRAGSAEFFQELGIPWQLTPAQATESLERRHFCFLFAPHYHRALRFAVAARRALGVKTILNVLGPLVNPAHATHQLIGVFARRLVVPLARAAQRLGVQRVMVVHGEDGLDEVSVSGRTHVARIGADGVLREQIIEPEPYGVPRHSLEALVGGDARENARLARDILAGRGRAAIRDAVILNSAAALSLCRDDMSMAAAVAVCRDALASGAVARTVRAIAASAA